MSNRPRHITVIGWLFIAVGAAAMLKDVLPLLTSNAAEQLAKLRADGLADLGPAWTSRLLAVIGGAGLLHGFNWARWLLVAWMAFHIVLSVLHSPVQLLVHCAFFAPILYFLFRSQSTAFLSAR
jgi:hypothetical protein